jgi:HK97 family phage major capsid protein
MADSTLNAIAGLADRLNGPQHSVKYAADGTPLLFGRPVYSDPNIHAIAASAQTVVFGDLSFWLTRYVPTASYLTRYSELPGFAEAALAAYDCRARFGGCLLSNASVQTPINYLQQTS